MSKENREQLLMRLESSDSIQAILDVALELIGNPMVMYDLSYKLLAYTENKVPDDPIWNEFVKLGKLSHETVNFSKDEKFIAAYVASPVALMKSPKLKYDRANAVIFGKDGLQLGNICVVACYKQFEEEDFKHMEIVCEYLANEIQKSQYFGKIPNVFDETIFPKLIDDTTSKPILSDNELKKLRQGFKSFIYVAVVDIIQYEDTLTHLVYFKELFREFNNEYQYFIYLNNVVILFSSDTPVLSAEKKLAEFNTFFSQNNIFAGVSSGFHSLDDLKTYFKEALNALNYGMYLNSGKNIFSYDNFSVELFVKSHIEEIDLLKLCHPILFAIRDYDNKNNTEYIEILYSFFISGLEHCYAAKRINMNCDDFKSHIKRAANLFQIDWNDGSMIFALFRSLRLFKCFPEKFIEHVNI